MWRFQQPLSGLSSLAKSNVFWLLLATLWQQSSRKCSTTPDEKLLGKTTFTVKRPVLASELCDVLSDSTGCLRSS